MPKIVKIPLIVLASLLGIVLILWGVMQTAAFQNYLGKKLVKSLSDRIGTEVSLSGIEIDYLDQLKLKDVLIRDEQDDTLFFIGEMQADYDLLSWSKELISLDRLEIDDAKVFLNIPEGKDSLNLQFMIESFKGGDSSGTGPVIRIDQLVLTNGHFNFRNDNNEKSPERDFNENNMHFRHISGELKDFYLINDSLGFQAVGLQTAEDCGLIIEQVDAVCTISKSGMHYDDLYLKTPLSSINKNLHFQYSSYKDFGAFISNVRMEADLEDAQIHTRDLAYFSNEVKVYDDLIVASGQLSGTVDRMRGKNLDVQVGTHTSYLGSARITGIPDMANTFWDINAKSFETSGQQLGRLIQLEEIPDELIAFGKMKYSGIFKGFLKEFVSIGVLRSDLGTANTDIKFGRDASGTEVYSGHIRSNAFDLGTLVSDELLGNAQFSVGVVGSGLEITEMQNTITGEIQAIDYNGYTYRNFAVNGDFRQYIFKGEATIKDPNLDMSFNGQIDLHPDHPNAKATTNILHADLQALGFDKNPSKISLSGEVDLYGGTLDELNGTVSLDSMNWTGAEQEVPISDLELSLEQQDGNHDIVISSDLADVEIQGQFKFSEVAESFKDLLAMLYPERPIDTEGLKATQYRTVVAIKQYHPMFNSFLGGLVFEQLNLEMDYTSEQAQFHVTGDICDAEISGISSRELRFSMDKKDALSAPSFNMFADTFTLGDSTLFYEVHAEGEVENDRFNVVMNASGDSNLTVDIDAYVTALNDSIAVYFNRVDANINQKNWHMGKTDFANIVYHEGAAELFYFDFRNKDEIVFFDGAFGDDLTKTNVIFSNFKLSNVNPFLVANDVQLFGTANGYIDLTYREGFPIFESDLVIDHLTFDEDTLGTFQLVSTTGDSPLEVDIDGRISEGLLNGLVLDGGVNFNTPEEALDLSLITQKGSIRPFEKYLDGLVSNLSGYTTANLKLNGPLDKPRISGLANLTDVSLTVDYLQTTYEASAIIEVGNDYLRVKEGEISDGNGPKGVLSGELTHKNYDEFAFDVLISELVDFECMNTTRKDNDLFYGTAFADGQMRISGPLDDILLQIDAKSRKNTKIHIPLDNAETGGGQLSYVEFVNFNEDNNKVLNTPQGTEGVRMDFNFEVTNDASVELIFDELLGDKITGSGRGNIRMEVNTYGDFNMYGNIVIDNGDYLFTAFNVINKYFTVSPGSTLSWDGDPYNATMDLTAIKREYPKPSTLTGETSGTDNPIPVDCELQLTGLLFNPEISFGLALPSQSDISSDATSSFVSTLERVRNDQEELDRQVFALLVLGRFITPSFIGSPGLNGPETGVAQSTVNNSLSDFVSSQLSNWISSLDPKLQVGIDYQTAAQTGLDNELVLSLKRKFLNDRLELQGSFDAGATFNNPYDVNLLYELNPDGSLRVKAFHRNANDPTLGNLSVTRSGVGFFYRYQFDHFWFEQDRNALRPEEEEDESGEKGKDPSTLSP